MKPVTKSAEFEQQAYDACAAEIRYAERLTAAEAPVEMPPICATVLSGLTAASEALRPLFRWNPQRPASNDAA